jgi:hypothetical protein
MTSFRRGRVSQKEQREAAKFRHPSNTLCFWCHRPAPGTPFRSPMPEPGGRYVVCGPACPERPEGAHVVQDFGAD